MSSLRPIKPLTFPDLKPAVVEGEKPSLAWVAPTSLLVDATYQRDLSDRSTKLIRKMVESFAWNRVKPPIVVRAGDEGLHIVDGQHTAIAAATLGLAEIPVFIVQADSMDERARAFVGHNSDRVRVSSFDIYRALLTSGDPDAMDVDNVCRRAGVRLRTMSPGSVIAEGDTAAIGVVSKLVQRRGVIPARKVLQALVKAGCAPISAAEILAAEQILCVERPDTLPEALAIVVREDGPDGFSRAQAKAKAERSLVWRAVMARWLRRLDRSAAA